MRDGSTTPEFYQPLALPPGHLLRHDLPLAFGREPVVFRLAIVFRRSPERAEPRMCPSRIRAGSSAIRTVEWRARRRRTFRVARDPAAIPRPTAVRLIASG